MDLFKTYHSDFFTVQYWKDENNNIGLSMLPKECEKQQVERRKDLHDEPTIIPLRQVFKSDFPADTLDPLVHIHIKGDEEVGCFSAGTSMRRSKCTFEFKFSKQWTDLENQNTLIHTELIDSKYWGVLFDKTRPVFIRKVEINNENYQLRAQAIINTNSIKKHYYSYTKYFQNNYNEPNKSKNVWFEDLKDNNDHDK